MRNPLGQETRSTKLILIVNPQTDSYTPWNSNTKNGIRY
jgi:hypothetical protein